MERLPVRLRGLRDEIFSHFCFGVVSDNKSNRAEFIRISPNTPVERVKELMYKQWFNEVSLGRFDGMNNHSVHWSDHHLSYQSLAVQKIIIWNQSYSEHFDMVFSKWQEQQVLDFDLHFQYLYVICLSYIAREPIINWKLKILNFFVQRGLDYYWWYEYWHYETCWWDCADKSLSFSTHSFNCNYSLFC